jgi:hypothetical protein
LVLEDDVEAVVRVDGGDDAHQRRELVAVVVLGGVRPGFVGDADGAVGDPGALPTEQPLIWLARISIRFEVPGGRSDPGVAAAELRCLVNFCRIWLLS